MDKPPPYNEAYSGYPGYAPATAPPPTAPGFAPMPAPPGAPVLIAPPPVMIEPGITTTTTAATSGMVTTVNVMPNFGDQPLATICPNCRTQIITTLQYEAGSFTYLLSLGLCFFVGCGCCLIPCCIDSCKDVHHYCPQCDTQLGIFKRI